jgi:hypothetical protein
MAFTSETILKFGSTGISFAVISLLDYSLENQKAGAMSYRRKESFSLQGYFSNRESSVPISEHFRQVKLLVENGVDFVDLQLNGKSYGKARFLGFDFPTSVAFDENAVRFSKLVIKLEVLKDDSSGTFANANLPSAVSGLTTLWYKLKDFTENFSFKLQEDGTFLASHNLSFGFDNIDKDTSPNIVSSANQIANVFFVQGLDALSSIRYLYSQTSFQVSSSDYGSSIVEQSADLINYSFSYAKNYTVFSDNDSNTSQTVTTELSYKEDGSIEVIEKGRVKGKGSGMTSARQLALARLETNLTNAYSNCNHYFQVYFSTYYGQFAKALPKISGSETLQSSPISITKDLTGVENEVGYEIRFTTNRVYFSPTRIHEYKVNLNRGQDGIVTSEIQGTVKYYTNKNKSFNKVSDLKTNVIDTDISDLVLLSAYYYPLAFGNGARTNSYIGIRTATSVNYQKFGTEASYTKSYSNSKTILSNSTLLVSSFSANENTEIPVNRFSTFKIPNYKEIIYQTRQLSEGTRNISIEMKLNREVLFTGSSSGVNNSHSLVFAKIRDMFSTNMLDKNSGYLFGGVSPIALNVFAKIFNENLSFKVGELTYFLEDLKFSFDNNYLLKADLTYKFLAEKEKLS